MTALFYTFVEKQVHMLNITSQAKLSDDQQPKKQGETSALIIGSLSTQITAVEWKKPHIKKHGEI